VSCGVWHWNVVDETPTQSQPGWQSWPVEQLTDDAQYPTGSAQTQISLFPQSESRTQP
jgi:hypothetical protein